MVPEYNPACPDCRAEGSRVREGVSTHPDFGNDALSSQQSMAGGTCPCGDPTCPFYAGRPKVDQAEGGIVLPQNPDSNVKTLGGGGGMGNRTRKAAGRPGTVGSMGDCEDCGHEQDSHKDGRGRCDAHSGDPVHENAGCRCDRFVPSVRHYRAAMGYPSTSKASDMDGFSADLDHPTGDPASTIGNDALALAVDRVRTTVALATTRIAKRESREDAAKRVAEWRRKKGGKDLGEVRTKGPDEDLKNVRLRPGESRPAFGTRRPSKNGLGWVEPEPKPGHEGYVPSRKKDVERNRAAEARRRVGSRPPQTAERGSDPHARGSQPPYRVDEKG